MTGIASVGVVSVASLEASAGGASTASIAQADGVTTTSTLTGSSTSSPACVAAGGVSATATLVASCVSAASITQADGVSATATLTAGTITLTAPVRYKMHQRDGSDQASIAITGTYTGSPTGIEARFNGGAWSTIVASPAGGTFSGSLSGAAVGQGTLDVRFTNIIAVTASVLDVGVGDIYVVSGQSNHSGRAATAVSPNSSVFKAVELKNDGNWGLLTENTTNVGAFDDTTGGYAIRAGQSGGVAGSYFGKLSSMLELLGVPTAFVPCAMGSTVIANWLPGADHHSTAGYYGVMLTRAELAGGHKALLWWQGEGDSNASTAQATYESSLNTFVDAWFADTGKQTIICKICASGNTAWYTTIRAGQANVIASNANVAGSVDMNVWATGNIHYSSSGDITAVATAMYNELVALYYTDAATITAAGGTSTAADIVGSATAAASVTQAAGTSSAATLTGAGLVAGASSITAAAGISSTGVISGAATAEGAITDAAGASTANTLVGLGVSAASLTPADGATSASSFAASAVAASVAIAAAGASAASTIASNGTGGLATYPDPLTVLAGISYGPTGTEYTGTMAVPTANDIATAVMAAINATTIPVDAKKMNGATILGSGTSGDKWRG